MLTLTQNAATTIRSLMDRPDLPAGSGLRVAGASDGSGLQISAATAPESGDEVVEESGARVFLDSGAASVLDDKVLDASTGDDGRIQFRLVTP